MIRPRIITFALVGAVLMAAMSSFTASALGLKIAPLEYRTTLKADERQKGVIDVSNPSGQTVRVKTSVQAFRQIDDDGGLQFYDDKAVKEGIRNDLQDFVLGPHEAQRMSFTINGTALPEGDVFAAIFFTTEPLTQRNGVGEQVRVGTLLSIVNKTPGDRSALITDFTMPVLQFSDAVNGSYKIKNTGPKTDGFYPTVYVSAWPWGKPYKVNGTLVFGGRERQNDFRYQTGMGIHLVEVSYGDSKKSQWVVTIAPWAIVLLVVLLVVIGVESLLLKRRKSARKKTHSTSGK